MPDNGSIWLLLIAAFVVIVLGAQLSDWLARQSFFWYSLGDWPMVLLFLGAGWLSIKLSRTDSTLLLDNQGFEILKKSTFNLLPKKRLRHTWSDFSYCSTGLLSTKFRGYGLSIHLKDGLTYDLITGLSDQEVATAQQCANELEAKAMAFKQANPSSQIN